MVKGGAYDLPVVLFTKESMDADELVPVVYLPTVRFIGGTTSQGRTGNIQGDWDPEILLLVIATVGVPWEKAFADIGMTYINIVIHMECDGIASCVRSLGEIWPTQSLDQWLDRITKPPSVEEVPNINLIIVLLPSTKKN